MLILSILIFSFFNDNVCIFNLEIAIKTMSKFSLFRGTLRRAGEKNRDFFDRCEGRLHMVGLGGIANVLISLQTVPAALRLLYLDSCRPNFIHTL